MTVELLIVIGIWLLAITALLGTAHLPNWHIARQKMQVPVAEKLLRGPGESFRKRLEELDEQIFMELAIAFVLPLLYVGAALVQERKMHSGWGSRSFYAVVGVGGYAVLCRRIHRQLPAFGLCSLLDAPTHRSDQQRPRHKSGPALASRKFTGW